MNYYSAVDRFSRNNKHIQMVNLEINPHFNMDYNFNRTFY